jgi:hypothetical protein
MAESFLLVPAEVEELTGAHRAKGQLEWLAANGYPAEVGKDGKVKVLRAAVEARMMPSQPRRKPRTEPNLAALRKAS